MPVKIGNTRCKIKKTINLPADTKIKSKIVGNYFTDRVSTADNIFGLPFLTNNYILHLGTVIVLYNSEDIAENNRIFVECKENPESNIWCYDNYGVLLWKIAPLEVGKFYISLEYQQDKDIVIVSDNTWGSYQLDEKSGYVSEC